MNYNRLNWFFAGTALALCLFLSAPAQLEAASSKEAASTVQKYSAKKEVKKESRKSPSASKGKSSAKLEAKADKKSKKNKKGESEKVAARKDKSDKSLSRKARSEKVAAHKDKSEKNKSDDTRKIWMDRARDSEILTGQASWYGKKWHKKATASGIDYDMHTFTAAHRTLPIGTVVKVTDQKMGKSVMVCVTDRGPFVRGRIIDLSYAAAKRLDLENRGVCRVNLEVVGDEKGKPVKPGHAFFVRYGDKAHKDMIGPFNGFADAAAMHEALRQAHPDAEVVLDSTR